jgi:hypothetical protein
LKNENQHVDSPDKDNLDYQLKKLKNDNRHGSCNKYCCDHQEHSSDSGPLLPMI